MIDTNTYKELLLQEESRLLAELNNLGIQSGQTDIWDTDNKEDIDAADREDVADALEDLENKQDTSRVLETELHEIRHALQKIEAGTYGVCEVSGEAIEEDRLKANPSARTCKSHMN